MRSAILAALPLLLQSAQEATPIPPAEVPALLDRLDRSFAKIGKFRVDYDVKGIPAGEGGPDLTKIVFHADPEASRSLIRMYAGGKDPVMNSSFEGWTGFFWKDASMAHKIDGTLLSRLITLVRDFEASVDRLIDRKPGGSYHPTVLLRIDGKADKERKGNFRFAMGKGTGRSASWITEISDAADAVFRRAGDAIRVELPSARKEFEIDDATGLMRRLRVRDYDGTVREISLAAFVKGEEAPDPGVPSTVKSTIPPADEFAGQLDEYCSGTWFGAGDLAKAWDRIDAAKKEAEAKTLLSGFYTGILHLWVDHAMQSFARQYVAGRREQGATAEQLKKNADLEFERFGAAITGAGPAKQLSAFVEDRAGRLQRALRKSLNSALANEKNAEALVTRTLEATCANPPIDKGDALIKRARRAFDLVLAHPEEL